jgi:hypothetical protein
MEGHMADELPKGPPPVTPKSKSRENLDRGSRANTGGDPYDRSRGNYSKTPPQNDRDDPFGDF